MSDLHKQIEEKYAALGENQDMYLKGLLYAKPINYWDYVEVDTLLSLQKPRTDFKDEEIFIMYHQVTELVLKMMIHELKQLSETQNEESVWIDKLGRLTRYTNLLISSFSVMREGMSHEDYNKFRFTLTPASGFQSAQFRFLEIYCTRLHNLLNEEGKSRLPSNPSTEDYFENIYWRDAGFNKETGKRSFTLRQFEEKYLDQFILLANKMKGKTVEERFLELANPSKELLDKLREFDFHINVLWPMTHLGTARHYLESKGEVKAATGGSDWQKYLHPKYQQRKFFPSIWTPEEIENWAKEL